MVSAYKMPKYLYVSFFPRVLIMSRFGSSIPSVRCNLPRFVTSMGHFSMLKSIPTSWRYILTGSIRGSSYFSFFANILMSSMSNIEQVLATTPHKAPTIRLPTTYHESYISKTNQTCRTLLEKQGRDRKLCTPVDPHIWPIKSRTASSNIHTAAMWWYGM